MEIDHVATAHTEASTRHVHVLVVDDSPAFIESAILFLQADPLIKIVGAVTSGADALVEVGRLQPDLVLMDVSMPSMNGLEATKRIKARPAPPCVIILALHDCDEYHEAARAVQADGFISKSDFGTRVVPLIYQMCNPPTA